MNDVFAALRIHIVAIAACATVVFGYVFKGEYPIGLALLCGFDWCIVNLLNRATDVDEDRLNGIAATEIVARHARVIVWGSLFALVASLVLGFAQLPAPLAWVRVLFHVLGLGYSFRYVPTPSGMKRFKDLYFLKNGMSAVMFLLSVGAYPLLGIAAVLRVSTVGVVALLLFFFLFELTFEVIYDMRDLEGDRAVGVPTYPVVHGMKTSVRIVRALCFGSIAVLVLARAGSSVLTRELLMVLAPVAQLGFMAVRKPEDVTRRDCIGITYAGAAMLVLFLAGTAIWTRAGLPVDF